MVASREIVRREGHLISCLEPLDSLCGQSAHGKHRNEHALAEKRCLLNEVHDVESAYAWTSVADPEKEPIVVTVRVHVILDHQVVTMLFLFVHINPTEVSRLEIRIEMILFVCLLAESVIFK